MQAWEWMRRRLTNNQQLKKMDGSRKPKTFGIKEEKHKKKKTKSTKGRGCNNSVLLTHSPDPHTHAPLYISLWWQFFPLTRNVKISRRRGQKSHLNVDDDNDGIVNRCMLTRVEKWTMKWDVRQKLKIYLLSSLQRTYAQVQKTKESIFLCGRYTK